MRYTESEMWAAYHQGLKDDEKEDNKWISSDVAKPDYNVSVLVFIPAEDNHCTVGMWDVSNKWVLLDEYRIPKSEVTYWREMVGLPEDKSYDPNHPSELSDEMDTTTEIIRKLQIDNFNLQTSLRKVRSLIYSKDEEHGGELVFPMDADFGTILATIDNTLAQLKEPTV